MTVDANLGDERIVFAGGGTAEILPTNKGGTGANSLANITESVGAWSEVSISMGTIGTDRDVRAWRNAALRLVFLRGYLSASGNTPVGTTIFTLVNQNVMGSIMTFTSTGSSSVNTPREFELVNNGSNAVFRALRFPLVANAYYSFSGMFPY